LDVRKLLQTAMHWQNRLCLTFESVTLHLFFLDKKQQHAVTSSERAHRITWYEQKRRRNRWASKQVSQDSFVNLIIKYVLTVRIECTHSTKQAMSK